MTESLGFGGGGVSCSVKQNRADSLRRLQPNNGEHLQGDAAMQTPLLDGRRQQEAAEEEEVDLQEVLNADRLGRKNSQSGEKPDGQHGGDGQGKSLRAPEDGHQQHHVETSPLLQEKE